MGVATDIVSTPPRTRTIVLNNGVPIPVIAFGTGTAQAWTNSTAATFSALAHGYTHLDCAWHYKNQKFTGRAIRQASAPIPQGLGMRRDEVFVCSKAGSFDDPPEKFDARFFLESCLKDLDTDYVDLFLVHADILVGSVTDTWRQMEQLYKEGLCRAIGVSNFTTASLQAVFDMCTIKPAVHQVELHPYSLPTYLPTLLPLCKEHNIKLMHYGPLVPLVRIPGGPVDAAVRAVIEERGRDETEGQVLLMWGQQVTDGIVVTTSTNPERLDAQIKPFLVDTDTPPLSAEHMAKITEAGASAPYRHWGKLWPNFMNGEGGITYPLAARGTYGVNMPVPED